MKNFHIGLLPRIIIAIILGILFGNFLPASLVRLFVTFNAIFSEFLNFSIPLIIVGLVTIAIADIGKGAGRMLVVTALIAYGATLFSGFLSYFTGVAVFPSLIETGVPLEEVSESQGILPYFSVGIPPLMNVMTVQRPLLKSMKLFFINVQICFLKKRRLQEKNLKHYLKNRG